MKEFFTNNEWILKLLCSILVVIIGVIIYSLVVKLIEKTIEKSKVLIVKKVRHMLNLLKV